jgi:hypothetical protein
MWKTLQEKHSPSFQLSSMASLEVEACLRVVAYAVIPPRLQKIYDKEDASQMNEKSPHRSKTP